MPTTLTIIRYRVWSIPFAFLSMMIFHIPLFINKKIQFYKLMGSGKNGSFDIRPDLRQWAIMATHSEKPDIHSISKLHGKLISTWLKLFARETLTILLTPLTGHGSWDGQQPFGTTDKHVEYNGNIAVLTRATIRLRKFFYFWKHVAPVASQLDHARGFLFSVGIGEVPWIKQATFSFWHSLEDMKAFAYGSRQHSEVIKKTRSEKWYSEDLFMRFTIADSAGTLKGRNPFAASDTLTWN